MLKKVIVNNKKVPVPVPVRTLGEALSWVEATLVPAGHTVTRIVLDDAVVGDHGDLGSLHDTELNEGSKLEVQIDSPTELTVQTLDAMRNLAGVINGSLKSLAVACWQAKGSGKPAELDTVTGDLDLIRDLLAHISGLLDPSHPEVAAIEGISALLQRTVVQVAMARANSDWKACARLLLNKLEPLLKDLGSEAESLQLRILAQVGQVAPTGSGVR